METQPEKYTNYTILYNRTGTEKITQLLTFRAAQISNVAASLILSLLFKKQKST